MEKEFASYREELEGLSGKEVLSKVYEFCDKEQIHDGLQIGFLRDEPLPVLNALAAWSGNLLDRLYRESLEYNSLDEVFDVISVVTSVANEIISSESLT